jgi:hypothetical protein
MPTQIQLRRLLALTIACLAVAFTFTTASAAAPNPVFKPIMSALKKTHVPVLLPSYVPSSARIYAGIIVSSRSAYEIDIAYIPNCHESTACHDGFVRGEAPSKTTTKLAGQKIALGHNLIGYFVDYKCGASCGDSTMAWNETGYRYTFGLHAGSLKQLKRMANSAINNGPQ